MSEDNSDVYSDDTTQQRLHYINQCDELRKLAKGAREDIKRENTRNARMKLAELSGRLESVAEDLDQYLDTDTK